MLCTVRRLKACYTCILIVAFALRCFHYSLLTYVSLIGATITNLQVDVLMLDLDVGFIDSPLKIVRKLHSSKKDIFVQVYLHGH